MKVETTATAATDTKVRCRTCDEFGIYGTRLGVGFTTIDARRLRSEARQHVASTGHTVQVEVTRYGHATLRPAKEES